MFRGTSYLKNECGAAAVEFSFLAPLLILLMVGIMDMGIYIRDKMKLEQISRAATDYLMQGGVEENIVTEVLPYYDENNTSAYTVLAERVCTCSDGSAQDCSAVSCDPGDYSRQYVQVTVDRTYTTMFPYPGIPEEIQMSGYSRLRLD